MFGNPWIIGLKHNRWLLCGSNILS